MEHDTNNDKNLVVVNQTAKEYHRAHGGYIFQSFGIRRTIQNSIGLDRVLLDYGRIILCYFSPIIYTVLLFT